MARPKIPRNPNASRPIVEKAGMTVTWHAADGPFEFRVETDIYNLESLRIQAAVMKVLGVQSAFYYSGTLRYSFPAAEGGTAQRIKEVAEQVIKAIVNANPPRKQR